MIYTTKQIAAITDSKIIGDENLSVANIEFDSRNIYSSANSAFLAINTSKNSGEKYIYSAVEKGIQIIISEHHLPEISQVTWIIVENSIQFIQKLAKYHLRQFHLKTIGITGSNGKTIVKEWLYQSIFEFYNTVKSPKSFNSQTGLPLSLLEIVAQNQLGIFEVGISKPGEMVILEDLFSPEIGVLTHIGTAHSLNFESEIQLIEEKILLFKNSKTIIFNGDNERVDRIIKEKYGDRKLISFGLMPHNNIFIKNDWISDPKGIIIQHFEEELHIPVHQNDEATLSNAMAVIACLKELGIENRQIIEKINSLRAVEMRLESVNGLRNNLIINDSYNLDLDSLKIAFQFIHQYNKKKKTLILTDFIEGKDGDKLYHDVAKLTNRQDFSKIFLIGNDIVKFENLFEAETFAFENTGELLQSAQLLQIEDEIILLKGARKFEIERLKIFLESQKHDTVLEVNLNAIVHNINIHKSLLRPETKMMAMVKAYSYGLGGYEIAEFLQHHHIDYLGVAYADEGIDLRKNGITVPIMVMNPEQHSYNSIIDFNLEPEIYSLRVLKLFHQQLLYKGIQRKYPIHIKLETGMHRLGFQKKDLIELLQQIKLMNVEVKSIFSHLSSADELAEKKYTFDQIRIFKENSDIIIQELGYAPLRHILNSSGIVNYPEFQFEMVRIGIGMVGISVDAKIKRQLRNAVSFKTVISQISEIEEGDSVGYSRKFKAANSTRIATIPVGYADGIPRMLGNEVGKVGIHKKLFSIIGNVCMDMMMINLENEKVNEGEEIIIFNENPSLQEFASYCNTIPYEVLTSISRRVKRIYIKD